MKEMELLRLFPGEDRQLWKQVAGDSAGLQEIRLRAGKPVVVLRDGEEFFLNKEGKLSREQENAYVVNQNQIQRMLLHNCEDSPYAYEGELRSGFLSLQGGHRLGIVGQAVLTEEGTVKTLKNLSGLNLRIAHEISGIGEEVLPFLYQQEQLKSTLLISPPGCGKTTLLRGLICQISDGNTFGAGRNVGVVDERGEIAACYMGIPQNRVGTRTDVLDACPKALGMMMLIRSMAPSVIAVDEIGGAADMEAISYASTCGIGILATIHGSNMEDLYKRQDWQTLQHCFELFVVLEKRKGCPGAIREIRERENAQITGRNLYINGLCGNGALL